MRKIRRTTDSNAFISKPPRMRAMRGALVPEPLTQRVIGVFTRMEYALKAAGLRQTRHGALHANWDAYGASIEHAFAHINLVRVRRAVAVPITPRLPCPKQSCARWQVGGRQGH